MRSECKTALKKAESEHSLTRREIITLLQADGEELDALYEAADRVRATYMGDAVHLRGLIEFSNYCQQNCSYCGLRQANKELDRYRMEPDEILATARKADRLGYKTVVLQSGEDPYYTRDMLAEIVQDIKTETDAAVTLCVGERSYEDYKLWRQKGADRYLLRHETACPRLYHRLHPGRRLEDRVKKLRWLKQLDYQVGSGNIIGLPGQETADIADDLLLCRELDLEMVGLGPFVSHPNTPLADAPDGTVQMTVKAIAITRLLLPQSHIPATTALGTLDPYGRQQGLKAGANVVMPNVTGGQFRELYELYPDKICINEEPENCRQCIGQIITGLGRTVARDHGHSPKQKAS